MTSHLQQLRRVHNVYPAGTLYLFGAVTWQRRAHGETANTDDSSHHTSRHHAELCPAGLPVLQERAGKRFFNTNG
jgi:phospholipase/lecithinase/hemolysin